MMAQYLAIKAQAPDCLLFYRMGDFYELFFADAEQAAAALDIALTKRGKHDGQDVAMCGVPVHAAEVYLQRLIAAGFRVAVAEQMEDPAAARRRGGKAVVARDIVRLVTPGTLTEDSLLDARRHNYLAALAEAGGTLGLAWLDISTGAVAAGPVTAPGLAARLAALTPGEVLLGERLAGRGDIAAALAEGLGGGLGDGQGAGAGGGARDRLTVLAEARFDSHGAQRRLAEHYQVVTLDGFGAFSRAETAALRALLDYVALTQKGAIPKLLPPQRVVPGAHMEIDPQSRRNLELSQTQTGHTSTTGSSTRSPTTLLAVMDGTVTAAGGRLLAERLSAPLTDRRQIGQRLDQVAALAGDSRLMEALRADLRAAPDIARALARLGVGRGGPRDLAAVRDGLAAAAGVRSRLLDAEPAESAECGEPAVAGPADGPGADGPGVDERGRGREALAVDARRLHPLSDLAGRLQAALNAEAPAVARDGGFIRAGFDPALDAQRELRDESRRLMARLEARYRQVTGVASLKVRHNAVLGYYVEATPATADQVAATLQAGDAGPDQHGTDAPLFAAGGDGGRDLSQPANRQDGGDSAGHKLFRHRQTLASAVRFTTVELAGLEERILKAADRALALELEWFQRLAGDVAAAAVALLETAAALAALDVAQGLAWQARAAGWRRPLLYDDTRFRITGGRHPVVEAALARDGAAAGGVAAQRFQPNDCDLSGAGEGQGEGARDGRLWLLTGPNMAGKSTFLRQNALIAIMAQSGSFVPAERAEIGIVDRLFSRVGAADDLARGRSTFMVEMVETAAILNQAGARALVILDEIGRGTATFDGLAIAWACLEHLHETNRCRGLFATHYHELTALAERLDRLSCHTMRVRDWQGEVVFLHEVAPGVAAGSYGIHVARLAGLPASAVRRAQEVLARLEAGEATGAAAHLAGALPLFQAARSAPPVSQAPPADPAAIRLRQAVAGLKPDALSPRQALDALYGLRSLLEGDAAGGAAGEAEGEGDTNRSGAGERDGA
ncbi:MAG: DNA mismatch repair protein MutS [Alphaproteobacteria bacterium]